jgi:hypothetical protein
MELNAAMNDILFLFQLIESILLCANSELKCNFGFYLFMLFFCRYCFFFFNKSNKIKECLDQIKNLIKYN